jgi:hypothetical protein
MTVIDDHYSVGMKVLNVFRFVRFLLIERLNSAVVWNLGRKSSELT